MCSLFQFYSGKKHQHVYRNDSVGKAENILRATANSTKPKEVGIFQLKKNEYKQLISILLLIHSCKWFL